MTVTRAVAYTMQALVKYHGLKDWDLRLPYHDSISVNTTCMKTEAQIDDRRRGGVFIRGRRSESANERLKAVFAAVAEQPRVLANSTNCPLYLLCFAAGNLKGAPIALRIANHLLSKGAP